jgi:acyl carrier protein phosphodiesterase
VNFLAHLYLSGDDPEIQLGNFIGDFVKGRDLEGRFPEKVARGIALHRYIDQVTDAHPLVKSSKDRIRNKYRHYSGVIIDIFYDHFLAVQWQRYHPEPLAEFASRMYSLVNNKQHLVPPKAMRMLPFMIRGNWLVLYAEVEGIRNVLTGMSKRTPYPSGMEHAADDLYSGYENFKQEFEIFFSELTELCNKKLENPAV